MKNYAVNRKTHLGKYAEEHHLKVGGDFQGKESKWKNLILKIDKTNRKSIIETIETDNLLNELKFDSLSYNKLHRFAHHLSSSQIFCYNFFRPMINEGHPNNELCQIFENRGIKISEKANCQFEYGGYKLFPDEGTEYDFHIMDCDFNTEVFIEVKYTEARFGRAEKDEKHRKKFKKVYKNMITSCACLKNKEIEEEDFFNHYQLFRNVLRITDKSKYTAFIFPKEHEKLLNEYIQFKETYINEQYANNVKAWYWEDLMNGKEESEFFKKYFLMD